MNQIEVHSLVKQYKNHRAVDGLSFGVPRGCLFGLLGPNGAGKTSTIRMINRITLPDEGQITFEGESMGQHHTEKIGYLPEERGLYKKMKVGEHLVYLARLRGLSASDAKKAIEMEFEKFEMTSWWNKKIDELSKGMQQKVQYVATTMHNPPLLILDEPFTGLDPVNTEIIKNEIIQKVASGITVVFSTHRMEQVEELCDRIVLIHQGRKILEGEVHDIKQQYKNHTYRVVFGGSPSIPVDQDILEIDMKQGSATIRTRADLEPTLLLRKLLDQGVQVEAFEELLPSLNQIFIQTVSD